MSRSCRRLMLSGAQGLLGRSVALHWLASAPDAEVVGFGRSPRLPDRYTHDLQLDGRRVHAVLPAQLRGVDSHPRYRYVRCALDDRAGIDALLAEVRPDVFVHAAAALRDDPVQALVRTNVEATASLVERCAAAGTVERFLLVSSGSVIGRATVDDALGALLDGPADPYAISKRAGEQMAAAVALRTGLRLGVARVFNLIGAGLQPRHLPAQAAARLEAVRRRLAPPLLELGDLSTRRDMVDVDDAARALVTVAGQPAPTGGTWGGLVDVGSGAATLMSDLVATLVQAAGLAGVVEVRERGRRPFDVPTMHADTSAVEALGVRPATPLAESCSALLAYVADQWDATG